MVSIEFELFRAMFSVEGSRGPVVARPAQMPSELSDHSPSHNRQTRCSGESVDCPDSCATTPGMPPMLLSSDLPSRASHPAQRNRLFFRVGDELLESFSRV